MSQELSNKFKAGDVVFLKSGGPPMEVSSAYVRPMVTVSWVKSDGKRETGLFQESSVTTATALAD
jgi:uncharacterized protein YodC (DUF2158 family)